MTDDSSSSDVRSKGRIGVLTGGGDAPGLNAVIRGIVFKAEALGYEVVGLQNGWASLTTERKMKGLDRGTVEDIHTEGGTVLGTSRTNPYMIDGGVDMVRESFQAFGLSSLIAIGGDDTLGVAQKLTADGINVVGVPKTIDNDLSATDYTFGFDTATNRAADAIFNLHTTARSHSRVIVVEVMGRHAGWITLHAGMAGGAHIILLPEEPFDMNELAEVVNKREAEGKNYTIIAVSEGVKPADEEDFVLQTEEKDAFGHVRLGGIGQRLAKSMGKLTGKESRHVVLGHLQRAGKPTAFDVVLGTRLGILAAEMVDRGEFGHMAALRGTDVMAVPLEEAVGTLKTVPENRMSEARLFWSSR